MIDGCLLLSLTLPFGWVERVGTRSFSPNAFIRIDSDGQVFLALPYVEGVQDSCALILILIAEELDVALSQVHVEHTPPNERLYPNAAAAIGNSGVIRSVWTPSREAAATARTILIAAAAKR